MGKSTLFNCVSSGKAQSANFPFCTIEPNLGSTNVPDKRLEVLSDICKPQRTIPATVDIVDIAGLVKGASRGEGLGNQFLANIRECDAILLINDDEVQLAHDLFLLTNKPVLYVCNVDDASAATGNKYVEAVKEATKDENAGILIISARTEADIAEMEEYEDRQMFLEEMGLEESGVVRLIQEAYKLLGLRTFFTAGADECRAWTIHAGDKAPKAAGVIHSDFEKGFIRAEVIKYEDFVQYKTDSAVRAAGKMGIEGKDYVVQDGDIMHFLFNV